MLRSSHQFLSSFLYYVIVIVIVTSFKFNSAFSQDSTSVNDSTQTDSLKTKEEEGKFFKKLFVKKHQYIRGDPFIDSVTRELVIPFDSVGSSVQIDSIRPADKKRIIFHTLSKANLVEMMNQKESYFIPGQLFKKFKLNSPGVYNKNEELFFENKISAFFTMSAQPIWNKSWDYYFLKHVFRYLVEPIVLSLEIPLTVRMYHAESKPVWNPSYEIIPKIHWAPKNVNKPVFSNIILSWGPMIHHSNGQEKLLWDTSGTVPYNEHFGSLSTWFNLLGLQMYYQWSDKIIGLNIWWEHHYKNHFEYPLYELNYGREKLQVDVRFIWTSKTWKIWKRFFSYSHDPEWKFNFMIRHENLDKKNHSVLKDGDIPANVKDKGSNYKRNITPVKFSAVFRPGFLEYWGIYFEFYRGSDYYNASFIRNIQYFRWGISFDKSPYYKKYK